MDPSYVHASVSHAYTRIFGDLCKVISDPVTRAMYTVRVSVQVIRNFGIRGIIRTTTPFEPVICFSSYRSNFGQFIVNIAD